MVVWSSRDFVRAAVVDEDGRVAAPPFLLETGMKDRFAAVVAPGITPGFVVAWSKRRGNDQSYRLFTTRSDAAGIVGLPHRLHEDARVAVIKPVAQEGLGLVLVVSAGTADRPVAEEAAVVAEALGNRVERLHDCGVAGLHRLVPHLDRLHEANVLVVVAGMEGALPTVVAGLVDRPVIAVPTSIGYGASFGGIAALLAMLNSCAPGISVVNIDNGYGAAVQASQINHLVAKVR